MPVPTDITAGTLTITNGSTAVTGVGTSWLASDLRQGDIILWIEGGDGFQTPILADVPASNTALTLVEPWEGPTLTGVRYRIRYQWDSSRVSAQSRQLIEMLDNGNVLALAGLTGPGVPVFNGPHSMVVRPETDFINGVAYDVQVDTLADRDAYDGQTEGFAVLVSDVGDGRSALYSKASNASGDWSDPAYITGPIGDTPDIEATVTSTAPGTTPTVTPVPITGGTRLDFTLPEASGFYNAGVYDIVEVYNQDDVVRHNGSSFIALQAVPAGQNPSNAVPPADTAYWQVLAARGMNGTGTVASVVEGDGVDVDDTDPENPVVSLRAFTGDSGSGGAMGGVPAPSAGDAAAGKVLGAGGGWVQSGGGERQTQYFTASGTYTRSAGVKSADIVVVGAGGGSSGCSGAASNVGMGNSGAAGAEAHKHISFDLVELEGVTQTNPGVVTATAHGFENGTVVLIDGVVGMTALNGNTYTVANKTIDTFELSGVNTTGFGAYVSGGTLDFVSSPVTVGAAGLAGVGGTTPTAGGNGGTTSVGGYCAAEGGDGGTVTGICTAGTSVTPSNQNEGGEVGVGDLVIPGQNSKRGLRLSGTTYFSANEGGSCRFGAGGRTIGGGDGYPGKGYGSGAGGPVSTDSTHRNGAAGAPGLAIIVENF